MVGIAERSFPSLLGEFLRLEFDQNESPGSNYLEMLQVPVLTIKPPERITLAFLRATSCYREKVKSPPSPPTEMLAARCSVAGIGSFQEGYYL